jgi:hypothetical protein
MVLEGTAFKKGHGYYVVKQPSKLDLDRGISHTEARVSEEQFFASNSWTARFPGFEDQLGTRKLQLALASKLAALIINRLACSSIKLSTE